MEIHSSNLNNVLVLTLEFINESSVDKDDSLDSISVDTGGRGVEPNDEAKNDEKEMDICSNR